MTKTDKAIIVDKELSYLRKLYIKSNPITRERIKKTADVKKKYLLDIVPAYKLALRKKFKDDYFMYQLIEELIFYR